MSQLGIVTYNIAKDWDLPTILSRLEKLGYEGVELRTTHAHKVEVNLSKPERDEVRKRFEDSPVQLAGLGSAFEYHAADPAVVRKNIDGTKEYVRLAHDVGIARREGAAQRRAERGRSRCHAPADRPRPPRDRRRRGGFRRRHPRGSARQRDFRGAPFRQDHGIRRSSQCLRMLELQPV